MMVREKMERKTEMEGGRNVGERVDGETDRRDGGREEKIGRKKERQREG